MVSYESSNRAEVDALYVWDASSGEIEMRVSVNEGDSGYVTESDRARYQVFGNGVKLECVISADEETGEVTKAALDENGNFVIDQDDILQEKIKFKKVKIVKA